jgi:Na+-driven multidrug efflux pump
LGIGTSTYVSHALGRDNRMEAARLTSQAHLLAFGLVTLLAITGLLTIGPLFTTMGATSKVLPMIRTYMTIWFIGLPFVILPMVGMNVLQATGDTKIPGTVLTLSVILNIILDPILIFGLGPLPHMGIAGAALATVIGRASSFFIVAAVRCSPYCAHGARSFTLGYRRQLPISYCRYQLASLPGLYPSSAPMRWPASERPAELSRSPWFSLWQPV